MILIIGKIQHEISEDIEATTYSSVEVESRPYLLDDLI